MGIVESINELCKNAGISLSALERELSFGKGTIYRWNEKIPSVDKVKKVADYFAVSVDSLLDREPSDEVEEMLEYLHKNPEMRVLLSSSSKLQKEDLEFVMQMVKRMNRESDWD